MSDVFVLGDSDTAGRIDMLTEKASEQGAVIAQTFSFDPGEAASRDDPTDVGAVVEALGRAIATRTSIWIPFPLQDVSREQHWRRLSLALQRHGLDLLMGPELAPCPREGGYSEIDAALRAEVRAVDDLDYAAMAAAGARSLGAEIEVALLEAAQHGVEAPERHFSSVEAAALFGRSVSWVSRGLREGVFTYPDGSVVTPGRATRGNRLQFTVPMLRAMAWSSYRRGALTSHEL